MYSYKHTYICVVPGILYSIFCYVDKDSVEYKAFANFYSKLTIVFSDKKYLAHFVSAGLISPNDVPHMSDLPDSDRTVHLLKNISAPLGCDEKQGFYKMLEIMEIHGNDHAQQLAQNIKAFVRGVDPVVTSESAKTAPIEGIVRTYVHRM